MVNWYDRKWSRAAVSEMFLLLLEEAGHLHGTQRK